MGTRRLLLPAVLSGLLLIPLAARGARAEDSPTERFTLENGLRVVLRPVKGAPRAAVVVLFDIGEAHDPADRSGLAHFVEHCYVTAAAGETPARTADDMIHRYGRGWNAQTGARYTVVAFEVPRAELAREIQEAADRMGRLHVTPADVLRERPRVLREVSNMFGGIPMLGAANRAREKVRPSPPGARKGGVPAHIEKIDATEVQRRYDRYYKPRNARIVVAGGFDLDAVRSLVAARFGDVPRGEPLPAAREAEPAPSEKTTVYDAEEAPPGAPAYAALAWHAPPPSSADYPAFLVLVHRLFLAQVAGRRGGVTARYGLLDEPGVLYLEAPLGSGETPEAAVSRLRAFFDEQTGWSPAPEDLALARRQLAPLLATADLPDAFLRASAYQVAFGIGRRDQLGIDGASLGEAILAIRPDTYRSMIEHVFTGHGAAVVVRRAPGAPR